jgi:aminopeptidase N
MRYLLSVFSLISGLALFTVQAWAIPEKPDKQRPLSAVTKASGGALSALQAAYDVRAYTLDLEILPKQKAIKGTGGIDVVVMQAMGELELDLDSRFAISAITINDQQKNFRRTDGKVFVALGATATPGTNLSAKISYEGQPFIGRNVPWDGGFVWSETADGSPWIASAVQGEGCDMWFPCQDHYSAKPQRADLRFTVPAGLMAASNGVLVETLSHADGRKTFHWKVKNPITPYNIALNVGPYVRIQKTYAGINGTDIPLEFWALAENEAKARTLVDHDIVRQMEFFEHRLGPFPWGNAKLGFAETPHLGMEHQTINAYGNLYKRDEHGFDWLLQHELSHEWFGNVMTHKRAADAWLHEGTGLYMQAAYSKYRFGEAAYTHTMYKSYLGLKNCTAVVGDDSTDMAAAFHSDIYGKGAWVLHTLRGLIGEDVFWRSLRRLIYDTPAPWTLSYPILPVYRSTDDFMAIVNEEAGWDLGWFFETYLMHADLPELEQERDDSGVHLRWKTPGKQPFTLYVPVSINGVLHNVEMPAGAGFIAAAKSAKILIDPNMAVLRALPIIGTCAEQEAIQAARRAKRKKQHEEDYGWNKDKDGTKAKKKK